MKMALRKIVFFTDERWHEQDEDRAQWWAAVLAKSSLGVLLHAPFCSFLLPLLSVKTRQSISGGTITDLTVVYRHLLSSREIWHRLLFQRQDRAQVVRFARRYIFCASPQTLKVPPCRSGTHHGQWYRRTELRYKVTQPYTQACALTAGFRCI